MNNWYKIGLPVLVAILMIVSAVSITIAVTKDTAAKQVVTTGYTASGNAGEPYAKAALCPSCPGYNQENTDTASALGTGTAVAYGCRGGGGCGGQCLNGDEDGTGAVTGGYRGGCGRCR